MAALTSIVLLAPVIGPVAVAALLSGIAVIISVARLLKLRGQHQSQSVSPAGCQEQ